MIDVPDIERLDSHESVKSLLKRGYGNDRESFLADLSRLLNRLLQTDMSRAAALVNRLKLIRPALEVRLRPRMDAMQARFAHLSGEHRKARQLYERAVRDATGHQDYLAAARMRQGLMDVLMYLGEYKKAVTVGRKALRYFRRKQMDRAEGQLLTNLGNIYDRQDRNRRALQYYDKAAAIFEREGGVPLAIVRFNQANVHANLNHLDRARKLYSEAARIYGKAGLELLQTKAEYSIAYLEFLGDHYSEALRLLERAGQKFEKLADERASAVTLLDLAEINLYLNQLGTTIDLSQSLTERFDYLGMRYEQGKAHLFAALALTRLGDTEPAVHELKRAERLFQSEGNRLWLAMVDLTRSRLHARSGDYDRAVAAAETAAQAFGRAGDTRRQVDAKILAAEGCLLAGNAAAAGRRITTLLARDDTLQSQRFRLADLSGQLQELRSNPSRALREYNRAVEIADRMLAGLYPDEIRFFFALDKQPTFARAAEAALEIGQVDLSLRHRLGALARINPPRSSGPLTEPEVPSELLAARDQLRAQLKRLERLPDTGQRALSPTSAAKTEQRLWRTEQRIRSWRPQARSWDHRWQNDIHFDATRHLSRGEQLLYPVVSGDRVGWYLSDWKGQTRFVWLPAAAKHIEGLVRRLQFVMEQPLLTGQSPERHDKAARSYLSSLYDLLLGPLEAVEHSSRLIIMLDGFFGQIPWAVLLNEDQLLIDECEVQLVTSPQALVRNRSRHRFKEGSILSVAGPALPEAEREAAAIGDLFPRAHRFENDLVTSTTLKEQLKRRNGFVHLAAHASCSGENPLFSRLLLGDGPLFPFDLFDTGVNAPLVTLSGCQTAAPGLYYGSSFSLARAFLQAGGRFVLASLWSVSDRPTRAFMVEFYRRLEDEQNIYKAYRSTVLGMYSAAASPAALGAFVLLGR
jgi:CHAT domain-containing protein